MPSPTGLSVHLLISPEVQYHLLTVCTRLSDICVQREWKWARWGCQRGAVSIFPVPYFCMWLTDLWCWSYRRRVCWGPADLISDYPPLMAGQRAPSTCHFQNSGGPKNMEESMGKEKHSKASGPRSGSLSVSLAHTALFSAAAIGQYGAVSLMSASGFPFLCMSATLKLRD